MAAVIRSLSAMKQIGTGGKLGGERRQHMVTRLGSWHETGSCSRWSLWLQGQQKTNLGDLKSCLVFFWHMGK